MCRYLKAVDKFNDQHISAFVTAGSKSEQFQSAPLALCLTPIPVCKDIKFMLLHESRNEDGIRNFFNEAYELYTKVKTAPAVLSPAAACLALPLACYPFLLLRTSPPATPLLYLQLLLNPFYAYDSAITSPVFDQRVRSLARRFL